MFDYICGISRLDREYPEINPQPQEAAWPCLITDQLSGEYGHTTDDLFNRASNRQLLKQKSDSRLRRRLLAIEKLDVAEKRQVLQLLDALIERGQLKRKAETTTAR